MNRLLFVSLILAASLSGCPDSNSSGADAASAPDATRALDAPMPLDANRALDAPTAFDAPTDLDANRALDAWGAVDAFGPPDAPGAADAPDASGSSCTGAPVPDFVAGVCDGRGIAGCAMWATGLGGSVAVARCVPPEGRCARADACGPDGCTCGGGPECADNEACVGGFAGFTCICLP